MKYIISTWLWFTGFLAFGIVLLIGNVALTFTTPSKIYHWYTKLFRFVIKILFVKVTVEKLDNYDKNTAYLLMPNHVSFFDAPLFSAYPPFFFNAVEANNHFKWPVYGRLIRLWGNIPIARESIRASLQSLHVAEDKLKAGKSILIFPEGHRTEDGKLQRLKKMPFLVAKEAGVAIIPVGLSGVYQLNRRGSFIVNPTHVKVKYGKIISAETVQKLRIDELVELTRSEIQNLIERP